MFFLSKQLKKAIQTIYKNYGENPGTMLVHTGAIGWVLSSLAQITALLFNDKINTEQKMFLIPQELGDAFVNIISFYTLTSGVKKIGEKLTSSGKIRSAKLDALLKQRGLVLGKNEVRQPNKSYVGDWDFDITKLPNYKNELSAEYKPFNNGSEVIAGLAGSILSSNLVTPIIRNYYASHRQKDMITHYNNYKSKHNNPKIYPNTNITNNISIDAFTKNSRSKYYTSGGNLKI